jgi:hypothetical protein
MWRFACIGKIDFVSVSRLSARPRYVTASGPFEETVRYDVQVVITENLGRPPEPPFDQPTLGEAGVLTGSRHVRRTDGNRR